MIEIKVIVLPIDGRKGIVMDWSECMERYSLTNEELRDVINNGTLIKDKFFIDEAIM